MYEAALAYELEKRGLHLARQQAIPVIYEAVHIHTGFHADLVVEDQVIVEIKALETVAPVHKKQLLTYLKLADKRLGLLINFNVALSKMESPALLTDLSNDSRKPHQESRSQTRQMSALNCPKGPLIRRVVAE